MWRRKMAARFSGEDGDLHTGKSDFLLYNSPDELVLNRSQEECLDFETQSSVDHSILAIFEDSVTSESKNNVEEESETLLTALTEMLDSVEEDEDGILSPFDILQDTKLLSRGELRDNSVSLKVSPSRLRPRVKPQNESFKIKTDGEEHQECKFVGNHFPQMLEAKVEVFTSTSLISLVNLMHPYCLKLQVEKEDKPRQSQSLFSLEEVWRYEQPTDESDEEINVVSDDEVPVKETKEEDADGKRATGQLLKSVLLNGNSSRAGSLRARKRVRFGSVVVASFDESEEESVALKSTKLPETPEGSTLEDSTLIIERNDKNDAQKERDSKGETKAKSLSLQEYRQRRLNRRPLVDKQGDHTTKWPCISEAPKELTPIFCFQGQKHNVCIPKTTHLSPDLHKPDNETSSHRGPSFPKAKLSTHLDHSRSKSSRIKSKMISPTSPLPADTVDSNVSVLEDKPSPVKNSTLLNIDPPNPVLLPMPAAQTASQNSSSKSRVARSRRLQEIQKEYSAAVPQKQAVSEPKPHLLSLNKDFNLNTPILPQEIKAASTPVPPTGSSVSPVQTGSASGRRVSNCILSQTKGAELLPKNPQSPSPDPVKPVKCPTSPVSQCPPLIEPPIVLQEELPHAGQTYCPSEEPSAPQTDRREPSAAVKSGIEAADLSSLLEQFEETQAIEVLETEPRLIPAAILSSLPTGGHVDVDRAESGRLQLKPSVGPLECLSTPGTLLAFQTEELMDVPEPLCAEIVLRSQKERKNPPSKSIQIIDPRPLPPKKTHTIPAESPPAHLFSHLCFDHDYCGSVDLSPVSRCITVKSLKETSKTTTEQQPVGQDSAPEEGKNTTSDEQSELQHHSEELWTSSEAPQFTGKAAKTQTPQSILPTPPPSPPVRGRDKRRYRGRSPGSDSSSRSRSSSSSSSSSSCASCSPKRPRIHHRRSESSSCSSSPCSCVSSSPPRHYRLSRSRSRSWSRSRSPSQSRSPSPQIHHGRWREVCSSRESRKLRREHEMRVQKLKAIDERRVVYVGRIHRTMTHDELRERFSQFGEVECVSLHFRDRGDHYGFVTFYNMEHAFAAIDNGGKLRKPNELPFDICFGGRRQFCNSDYADLDANREADPSPSTHRFEDLDFDSLLKQAQKGLKR